MSPGSRVLPHRRSHRGAKFGLYGCGSAEAVVVAPAVGMWVTAERLSKLCVSRAPYPRLLGVPAVDTAFALRSGVSWINRRMLPHLLDRPRRAAAAAETASRPVPRHPSSRHRTSVRLGTPNGEALTQFASTSREVCDASLTTLVQIARDDALARARAHGHLPPQGPR